MSKAIERLRLALYYADDGAVNTAVSIAQDAIGMLKKASKIKAGLIG
jgi:hypothetical protein